MYSGIILSMKIVYVLESIIYRGFETNAIKVYDVKGKNSFDVSLCWYGSAI